MDPPCRSCCSMSSSCWMGPTLSLLSFPSDYFITVNHGGLWQRHIAWAKPKGQDLRAYISSQYSTSMVLLSLLLAMQVSVFFNSAHELCDLRARLLAPLHVSYTSPKYWVGFVLLMNICVTVMGILATFTTWGIISSISDRNSHCLLRSSMGQYVTSLPPRLVVASLYLCLTWFLLFVVELLAFGPLLVGLMGFVTFLFFSIVIPLSAFGRLIMHTGAMAERPVLSEELEKELLPTGLYASLLICALHHQRRNTSVTHQYRRSHYFHQRRQRQHHDQQLQQGLEDEQHIPDEGEGSTVGDLSTRIEDGGDQTPPQQNTTILSPRSASHHQSKNSDITLFVSDHDDDNEEEEEPGQLPLLGSDATSTTDTPALESATTTLKETSTSSKKKNNAIHSPHKTVDAVSSKQRSRLERSTPPRRRRTETFDSMVFLPPATILNMSLSGKQFQELIDSAIDTSPGGGLPPPGHPIPARPVSNIRHSPAVPTDNPMAAAAEAPPDGELPLLYPMIQSASINVTSSPTTRHHRRASSSHRFSIHEWAKESSIRDLYGVAPPADLPSEITLLEEQPHQHGQGHGTVQPDPTSGLALHSSSAHWSPGSILGRSGGGGGMANWIASAFSTESDNDGNEVHHEGSGEVGGDNVNNSQNIIHHPLTQPLLPDLEEAGRAHHGDDQTHDEDSSDSSLRGVAFLTGRRRDAKAKSNRWTRRRR